MTEDYLMSPQCLEDIHQFKKETGVRAFDILDFVEFEQWLFKKQFGDTMRKIIE